MRWLDGIVDSMDMSLSKLLEIVRTEKSGVPQFIGLQRVRRDLVTEQQTGLTQGPFHQVERVFLQVC